MDNLGIKINKPKEGEYGSYYLGYINQVNGDDALKELQRQYNETPEFLKSLHPTKWEYSYAEGKWTIKEIMVHLMDAERVFAYRALRLSRLDEVEMPGFDQDLYAGNSRANSRTPESIIEEYKAVRKATIELLSQMEDHQLQFIGKASGAPISARALAWIIGGHENHHLMVIRERYLEEN